MIALLGVLLALFAVGCSDEGNVFSLGVGDCLRRSDDTEISDVPMIDCSEPHEHEVFAVWNVTGDSLPSHRRWSEGCVDRFDAAIGDALPESAIYTRCRSPRRTAVSTPVTGK